MRMPLQQGLVYLLLILFVCRVEAEAPVVSNVRASQRAGTKLVDVYYDLADADSGNLTVSVAVSTNGGATYFVPGASATGALGAGLAPGSSRKIVWNAGVDLPAKLFSNVRVSITASDDTAPSGMTLIPAGPFTMGNTLSSDDGYSEELPLHTVYVSAFYMDKYEVTKALLDDVHRWATNNGYSFTYAGSGKGPTHPVQAIDWYDCVKWCNARSEKEGKTPAYYTNATQTGVYRKGALPLANTWVNWNAGYRLPTEAEWEKAARGGIAGQRFPWANTNITHSLANYFSSASLGFDTSPTRGRHPAFQTGGSPYTSPVGYFGANGYGLYDMAGNVHEWCWDWFGYYLDSPTTDPRGPDSGSHRVHRGGSWSNSAIECRAAYRYHYTPGFRNDRVGFRSVLPPAGLPMITVQPLDKSVKRGSTATFSVTASGEAQLSYQWRLNGVDIPSATGSTLTVTNVQLSGDYSVVVTNGLGIVTSRTARLTATSSGIGEI